MVFAQYDRVYIFLSCTRCAAYPGRRKHVTSLAAPLHLSSALPWFGSVCTCIILLCCVVYLKLAKYDKSHGFAFEYLIEEGFE